jgi:hypothetical protein
LRIYPTGSLLYRQSQQSFNTLTPFYFLSHSLYVSAPTGHHQERYTRHLHLQHRQHTSHEEETSNNRRKTKSLYCPQLDHHDADGLAGHKTWRTTQTNTRYKCAIPESAHSSRYFNILYMGQLFFMENFAYFTIVIFIFNLITCIRTTSRSTDVQYITSRCQIAYVQRIRCIKNSPSNI